MVEFWTLEAKETFKENIIFLDDKFTDKEVDNFVTKTYEVINHLLSGFLTGQKDKSRDAYKFLIVSQIYLFYKIEGNRLILLTFWNNHKRPLFFEQ